MNQVYGNKLNTWGPDAFPILSFQGSVVPPALLWTVTQKSTAARLLGTHHPLQPFRVHTSSSRCLCQQSQESGPLRVYCIGFQSQKQLFHKTFCPLRQENSGLFLSPHEPFGGF